jgi:xanthosine utilization system XapX-like protein
MMELLNRLPRAWVWPLAALPLVVGVVLTLVLLRIPAPPVAESAT